MSNNSNERYFDFRNKLSKNFEETETMYTEVMKLDQSVKTSQKNTKIYKENPAEKGNPGLPGNVTVTNEKTLTAAKNLQATFPECKVAVLNFASATNPGGGVKNGSRTQEECLCRETTLYPCLNTKENFDEYYGYHRLKHDFTYSDRCIYTPGIMCFKNDEDFPEEMPEEEWFNVDVITCAAPNLRLYSLDSERNKTEKSLDFPEEKLLMIHKSRAERIIRVAVDNGVEVLVLGAFGCGAFRNNPEIVAKAYKEVLEKYKGFFREVRFAVYCSDKEEKNYKVFKNIL